jgi:hypothetical protein
MHASSHYPHILRLQIPVNDIVVMQVFQRQRNLRDVETSPFLAEFSRSGEMEEELTALTELQHEKQLFGILESVPCNFLFSIFWYIKSKAMRSNYNIAFRRGKLMHE